MNNVQLCLAIGAPIIAILASMTLSLVQISGIRDDMRSIREDMRENNRRFDAHFDALTGKVVEIDNRLTRIEERMSK